MTSNASHAPLPDVSRPAPTGGSPLVRAVQALEGTQALDTVGAVLSRLSTPVTRAPALRGLLQGRGAGHAIHPPLTDVPVGLWTSAVVLDLIGGEGSRDAARTLLGAGLLAAVPTAATGFAEWHDTGNPERRVGAVHALLNTAALGLLGSSWLSRGRGRHGTGVASAMAGMAVATASAYLGGHLATARKVGTRDAAFDRDGVGPALSRPAPASGTGVTSGSDDPVTD
jgi:uncharacterized membrane protein